MIDEPGLDAGRRIVYNGITTKRIRGGSMTRGKYANRAHNRLQEIESQALADASAEIKRLKKELANTKCQISDIERDTKAKAIRIAQGLSQKEKAYLRNQVESAQKRIEDKGVAAVKYIIGYLLELQENYPDMKILRDDLEQFIASMVGAKRVGEFQSSLIFRNAATREKRRRSLADHNAVTDFANLPSYVRGLAAGKIRP